MTDQGNKATNIIIVIAIHNVLEKKKSVQTFSLGDWNRNNFIAELAFLKEWDKTTYYYDKSFWIH